MFTAFAAVVTAAGCVAASRAGAEGTEGAATATAIY